MAEVPKMVEVKGKDSSLAVTLYSAAPSRIVFAVDPVGWYLLYHDTPKEIAEAMKSRKPVKGMNFAQAVATFGQPEGKDTFESRTIYNWIMKVPIAYRPQNRLDAYSGALAAAATDKENPDMMRPVRAVRITFIGDRAVDISDQKMD